MNQFIRTEVEKRILTQDAVAFLIELEEEFGWRRGQILKLREEREARLLDGELPGFLPETEHIRSGDWTIDPVPAELEDRRVEITGTVDAKMMINALNSGARVFMADFEDATSPTWTNLLEGQANLIDAYNRDLRVDMGSKSYHLNDEVATLIVRPRGWHLEEKHFLVDGSPMSASLFDFGLYVFHGGRAALQNGSRPFVYLPKLESHLEARLWNDVFTWSEARLGIDHGTIKATVLIETILAAFEMDEILYELRHHAAGLNAGRWDYIFSIIKKLREDPNAVLPDRRHVTMTVPFMGAYTELMVKTCHRRGAHAIGGMAAFVPNRRDPEATRRAIEAVRTDKTREAEAGCDGTWVAHPDLVESVMDVFDEVLGDRPNQIPRQRDDVSVEASDLLDFSCEGDITLEGIRTNVEVGIRYIASWLDGTGALSFENMMEDAATAEISRSQVWQWVRHGAVTRDGAPITESLIHSVAGEVVADLEREHPDPDLIHAARKAFEDVSLNEDFIEFLTLPTYELIN